MDLKYKSYIDKFKDCESSNCASLERNAFRWVFENINDSRNFLPRYLLKPDLKKKNPDCLGYALSMFDEAEQAKARIAEICKDKNLLYKVLGTHLGEGIIKKEHGISNKSSTAKSNLGHFSFFEYINVDLSQSFRVVEKIEEND